MVELRPVRTKKIYQHIVEQITELIAQGNLKPGDRLLSERELADRLQVSRSSVREALTALASMGVVDVRPGEGTFVRQVNAEAIAEPLAVALLMDRGTTMELLEVRKMVEVEAAGLAATRADQEDLDKLSAIIANMQSDLAHGVLGEEADLAFHLTLAEAAGNPILHRLISAVSDTMQQSLRTSRQILYTTPGHAEELFRQHCAILKGVTGKNPQEAQRAMVEHLAFVERELRRKWQDEENGGVAGAGASITGTTGEP